MGTPRVRSTVESVRSRCRRLMGSFAARWAMWALATPRLPSEFSKSMGFTCTQSCDSPHWGHCWGRGRPLWGKVDKGHRCRAKMPSVPGEGDPLLAAGELQ